MPILATIGGGSSRGFGRGVGAGGPVLADDTNLNLKVSHTGNNSSGTISIVSGYAATLRIWMVGDGTPGGLQCCGNCGKSASGEYAQFDIVMGGDETSISYSFSNGSNQGASGTLSLTVNGGTRAGTVVRAGSGGPHGNYGNACPPSTQSSNITGSATRNAYGAYAISSGNYYGDGYYYTGCAGYGNNNNGLVISGQQYGNNVGGCGAANRGAIGFQYLNDY